MIIWIKMLNLIFGEILKYLIIECVFEGNYF